MSNTTMNYLVTMNARVRLTPKERKFLEDSLSAFKADASLTSRGGHFGRSRMSIERAPWRERTDNRESFDLVIQRGRNADQFTVTAAI